MIQVTLPRDDLARLDQIIARFQVDSEEAPAGVAGQVTISIFPGLSINGTESSVKEIPHKIWGRSVQETAFPPSPYPTDPDLALRAPMPVARPDPPP